MINLGYLVILLFYIAPILFNVSYLINLWLKGLVNPFSVIFSELPVGKLVLSVSLFATAILTYIALLYGGRGISEYLIDSIVENECFPYPVRLLKIDLLLRYFATPIVLLLIAYLGGALSYAFKSILLLTIWYAYSLVLIFMFYPDLKRLEDRVYMAFNRGIEIIKKSRGKIKYADNELVIKENVLIKRGWLSSRIIHLKNITSYGYVNSSSIYIKCRNLPVLVSCSDGKRAYKLLKETLLKSSEEISPATISEVESYIFLRKVKFYSIIGVILISFVLLLGIYMLPQLGIL